MFGPVWKVWKMSETLAWSGNVWVWKHDVVNVWPGQPTQPKSKYTPYNEEKMGHLAEKRTTYCSHMSHAFSYAARAFTAGFILIIHGLIPDVFTETGSNILKEITFDIDTANMEARMYGHTKKHI